MKKFICKNCKTVCYSAADWSICPDCRGELEEVSMTEKKDAPDILEDDHDAKIQLQYIAEPKENQIPDEILRELAIMHKRFQELYRKYGLCGIGDSAGVHITDQAFLGTFTDYETFDFKHPGYSEQLEAVIHGVKFFCIR
jgi:hypothetical protein